MFTRPHRTPTPTPMQALTVESLSVPADGFLSEATVDAWGRAGLAVREAATLTLRDGRVFALVEGLRILGRRDGESDPYSLTGRVVTLGALLKRGAVLSANGVRIGAATYDIELGFVTQALPTRSPSSPPPTKR